MQRRALERVVRMQRRLRHGLALANAHHPQSRECDLRERFADCSKSALGITDDTSSAAPSQENEDCNIAPCCDYSTWSDWSECSKECNGGERTQTRELNAGGARCNGTLTRSEPCNTQPCVTGRSLETLDLPLFITLTNVSCCRVRRGQRVPRLRAAMPAHLPSPVDARCLYRGRGLPAWLLLPRASLLMPPTVQ